MRSNRIFLTFFVSILLFIFNLSYVDANVIIGKSDNFPNIFNLGAVPNPDYDEYLDLSDEEKAKIHLVPEKYLYVYNPPKDAPTATYPSKYNLRDYNYVTAVKDQSSSGLCWAHTIATVIESSALKQGVKNVTVSAKYSDYTTVMPSAHINEGINPYIDPLIEAKDIYHSPISFSRNTITSEGGHDTYIMQLAAVGYSPALTSVYGNPLPTSSTKESLSRLFNLNNNNYSITEWYSYPTVYSESEAKSWREMIKYHIMNYGPLYVHTIGPQSSSGSCWNGTYKMIMCHDSSAGQHAMTIIGWDDNYGPNNEGAWILQNSWGASTQFPYLSYKANVVRVSGIKKIETKKWDNSYDYLSASAYKLVTKIKNVNVGNIQTLKMQKSADTEILKYLTFTLNSSALNQQFDVYVSATGKENDLKYVGSMNNTTYNGMHKLDIDNIYLENDNFLVGIKATNKSLISYYTITAFTSNIENNTMTLNTQLKSSSYLRDSTDPLPTFLTTFINFKNNQTIATAGYKIHNSKGQDVTNNFTLDQSYNSFKNYIINGKSVLRLSYVTKNLPADWYTIKINNGTYISDSMFDVSFLTSSTTYTRGNGYMYLGENTSNTTFATGLKTLAGTSSKIYSSTKEEITPSIIGTGMILRLINNGETIDYKMIIPGDVDGDGAVDAYDVFLMKRYGVGIDNIEGSYFEAGDIDKDKLLDAYDVLLVRRYIVGLGEL